MYPRGDHRPLRWPASWQIGTAWHLVPARRGDVHALLRSTADLIRLWHSRVLQRHELARLDLRMQHDIGITPGDVDAERNKWFWQA